MELPTALSLPVDAETDAAWRGECHGLAATGEVESDRQISEERLT